MLYPVPTFEIESAVNREMPSTDACVVTGSYPNSVIAVTQVGQNTRMSSVLLLAVWAAHSYAEHWGPRSAAAEGNPFSKSFAVTRKDLEVFNRLPPASSTCTTGCTSKNFPDIEPAGIVLM
jgi:hypothetical protein